MKILTATFFFSYIDLYQFLHSIRTFSNKRFVGRLSPCLQTASWPFRKSCATWTWKRWTIKHRSLRRLHWWHSWSMKPWVPINFIKNIYLQSNTNPYSILNVIFKRKAYPTKTSFNLLLCLFFFNSAPITLENPITDYFKTDYFLLGKKKKAS